MNTSAGTCGAGLAAQVTRLLTDSAFMPYCAENADLPDLMFTVMSLAHLVVVGVVWRAGTPGERQIMLDRMHSVLSADLPAVERHDRHLAIRRAPSAAP
jgi:hypothetical protein